MDSAAPEMMTDDVYLFQDIIWHARSKKLYDTPDTALFCCGFPFLFTIATVI